MRLRVVDYSTAGGHGEVWARRYGADLLAADGPQPSCADAGPDRSSGRLLVTQVGTAEMIDVVSEVRAAAFEGLPRAYSLALRLRDAGVSTELIADCLDIAPEGVDPLLRVAEAKLAALQINFV